MHADPSSEEALELGQDPYQANVEYLVECRTAVTDLRDKAYFQGMNELGGLLEAVRADCEQTLAAMMTARAGTSASLQEWLAAARPADEAAA